MISTCLNLEIVQQVSHVQIAFTHSCLVKNCRDVLCKKNKCLLVPGLWFIILLLALVESICRIWNQCFYSRRQKHYLHGLKWIVQHFVASPESRSYVREQVSVQIFWQLLQGHRLSVWQPWLLLLLILHLIQERLQLCVQRRTWMQGLNDAMFSN